jgi:hypothetical protein
VIRFGLRLTLAGGREAATRLVMITVAVAIGVGLLLATLAGVNGVNAQNARYAWLNSGIAPVQPNPETSPLWFALDDDFFDAKTLGRIDVAATGPDSPVPPGIPRLPGPGEYYASPALAELLATTPGPQLGDRFGSHMIGIIPGNLLPAPNTLLALSGRTPQEVQALGGKQVTSILQAIPADCRYCITGINAAGLDLVLSVVALALLFPVLMFIGTATRLSATRREQRYAAMRLVGATPRQISVLSTVESTVAAAAGTLIGFGLFLAFHRALAAIPFTGAPFFPQDFALNVWGVLGVAVGVPVGAAVAARIALRRVQISPLGVTRRVRPKPPSAFRLIPLLAGLAELRYFLDRRPITSNGQVAAYLPGFLLVMAGLVIAGPWLTMVGARLLAARSRRPATLIAARRLADDPKARFRAVSGLTLALFITTVAIGVIGTINFHRGAPEGARTTSLSEWFHQDNTMTALPGDLASRVSAVPGVGSILTVHANPMVDHPQPQVIRVRAGTSTPPPTPPSPWKYGDLPGLVACTELAKAPEYGRCAPGAQVASVFPDFTDADNALHPERVWPTATASLAVTDALPLAAVTVGTDGSTAAIEQARTVIETALRDKGSGPYTPRDLATEGRRTLALWQQLASVVILTTLPIAGCSLAVSVAGGLVERKRPFSLLRLTGVPLKALRNVVALESAAPLVASAAVAVVAGLVASDLFLRSQMHYRLIPLSGGYYAIVGAGIAASLGIIASTLPLLRRITGPETARNE